MAATVTAALRPVELYAATPPGSPGPRLVDHDLTLDEVTLTRGERIEIAAGATLRLTGDLVAPAERIFVGAGRVDLTASRIAAARPEWWGAVADDAAVDCVPAFAACLAAHPAMQLGLGDYHLASTLHVALPNRRIWGIGRTNGSRGTRLVRAGGGGAVVMVGTEAAPARINDYLRGIDLRWLELARSQAPGPGDDGAVDDAVGLRVRHVLDCSFAELRAHEHAIGYSLRGAVRSYLRDCTVLRSLTGAAGEAGFIGFDCDGRRPPIPSGGNASLYIIDCNARTGGHPKLARAIGARLRGAMSDTFLVRFETSAVDTGILIDGLPGSGGDVRARQIDIHIETPVLDGCSGRGIAITGLDAAALIDITSPYVALGGAGHSGISVEAGGGNVAVSGGQLIGWIATAPSATGIALSRTGGVAFSGTRVVGFARPVDATATSDFELVVAVDNRGATPNPAIRLAGCRRGYVRPRITGGGRAFAAGVVVEPDCQAIVVEPVGIDPAAVAAGRVVVGAAAR